MMTERTEKDVRAIVDLERRRCEFISANDIDGFEALLSDDYVHVHVTGKIDDKGGALAAFRKAPRQCWRGELAVRIFGDVAIAVGPQTNRMVREGDQAEDRTLIATAVLRRQDREWQIVHFHACSLPH